MAGGCFIISLMLFNIESSESSIIASISIIKKDK